MLLNDPIGDLLTRMRNAQSGRHTQCEAPWSRIKEQICELLKEQGYLSSVEVTGEEPHRSLVVTFVEGRPPLELKRVSTPGSRKYVGTENLRSARHGYSTAILSTSAGLLTDKQAKEKNAGGELLCLVS